MKSTQAAFRLLFSPAPSLGAASVPVALLAISSVTACVTVNVNFPEATVQQATDDYVRDLYRAKEKGRATPSPAPRSPTTSALETLFVSSAYAAEIPSSFRMDGGTIPAIRKRQAARLDKVLAAKRAGQLGETQDGFLKVDPAGKLKDLLKKSVEPLADEENKDRRELYAQVLETNSMSKNRLKDIQKSFARSLQSSDEISPSGTWIQAADGKWSQKP